MPLFIRRVTRAASVDFFCAVEADTEAQAELSFDNLAPFRLLARQGDP